MSALKGIFDFPSPKEDSSTARKEVQAQILANRELHKKDFEKFRRDISENVTNATITFDPSQPALSLEAMIRKSSLSEYREKVASILEDWKQCSDWLAYRSYLAYTVSRAPWTNRSDESFNRKSDIMVPFHPSSKGQSVKNGMATRLACVHRSESSLFKLHCYLFRKEQERRAKAYHETWKLLEDEFANVLDTASIKSVREWVHNQGGFSIKEAFDIDMDITGRTLALDRRFT